MIENNQKIPKDVEAIIEWELYRKVKLIVEAQYNMEGNINLENKDSTKLIFKNKHEAIEKVAKEIEEFSKEHNVDIEYVKEYLLNIANSNFENWRRANPEKDISEFDFKIDLNTISCKPSCSNPILFGSKI